MADKLNFDGRVALITGAGGGLGKQYALRFAERGAKVVVNDLGGDMKGDGKSSRAADIVVDEIRAKGGTAVANYDSVEDGEKLIQTALDNFGRIDIVVNNAGILRDKSFARTSDLDWDLIHRVHLRGSFLVTRAAWPHMKQQKYGRIIMTTSSAGLYGNFGQANYSAAKLGLVGLSNTLSKEGEKYNIHCNALAPMAGSRLTATVMPPDILDALKPEFVAPVVLWMCHEDCSDSGNIVECGAGYVAKVQFQKSKGVVARKKGQQLTPEQVRDSWEQASDFTESINPRSTAESNAMLYTLIEEMDDSSSGGGPTPNPVAGKANPDAAIGLILPGGQHSIKERDVMLYALGVGVSTSQPDFLKFLFEMNEHFCTLPSYGAIIGQSGLSGLVTADNMPVSIDPTQILHGEQYLELFKPIPTEGNMHQKAKIVDVVDKGRGALFIMDVDSFDDSGERVMRNQSVVYVQRMGGWGGRRSSDKQVMPQDPPKRAPDASMEEKTGTDQAAIYRLSGDYNPLHIDPDFAAMGGFDRPILHGLCSFGYAARHVLKRYCNNDVSKFKAIKVRFTKPVLPGQTLRTEMWREGTRIFFQTKVVENGNVCLSGAYVDLHSVAESSTEAEEPSGDFVSTGDLMSDVVFSEIGRRVEENADLVKKVKAIYLWQITKDGKPAATWTVDLKNGAGAVYRGEPREGKAGVTITVADQDFIDLVSGKLNGQQAFFNGKIKVKGNIMLTMKMEQVFKEQSKL